VYYPHYTVHSTFERFDAIISSNVVGGWQQKENEQQKIYLSDSEKSATCFFLHVKNSQQGVGRKIGIHSITMKVEHEGTLGMSKKFKCDLILGINKYLTEFCNEQQCTKNTPHRAEDVML